MKIATIIISMAIVTLCSMSITIAQTTVETAVMNEYVNADIQTFKFIDKKYRYTFFNRTFFRIPFGDNKAIFNIFPLLGYVHKSGLGVATAFQTTSWDGFAPRVGPQFAKQKKDFLFYGVATVRLHSHTNYELFTLTRFTPPIKNWGEHWKYFGQLEASFVQGATSHEISVQRLRAGLEYNLLQFGAAIDNWYRGEKYLPSTNFGFFIRMELK